MNYQTFEPHSDLSAIVKCHWILEVPGDLEAPKQRVIPDGCIEMCFILGDDVRRFTSETEFILQPRAMVFGQITRPYYIQPTGYVNTFAIRFYPFGFANFIDQPIQELADKETPLTELFEPSSAEILEQNIIDAHFNNNGGYFTQSLAECLRFPHIESVYDQVNETITFQRWFDSAVNKLQNDHSLQIPFCGGTLGGEELIPYDNDKLKIPGYNSKTPIQSIYQKLFDLLNLFRVEIENDTSFISGPTTSLYQKLIQSNNRSFLFYRVVDGSSRGEFINMDRFEYYLELSRKINLVRRKQNQNWEIRPEGIKAIRSKGEEFNTVLVHYILYWMLGISIELRLTASDDINTAEQISSIRNLVEDKQDDRKELRKKIKQTLKSLVDTGKIPNLHNIYSEFYQSDLNYLAKDDLKVALRLLSYTEVLKKADSDTYFY